jgi:TolB-like protein
MRRRYVFGPFELDAARGSLTHDGAPVTLGHRAVVVLERLLQADGEPVSKEELLAAGWPDLVVEESNLSVQIAALRKILSLEPQAKDWIATISRVGYRFTGPVRSTAADPASRPSREQPPTSILVLPFANLSGRQEDEYFVDGITEEVVNALSAYRWFSVISRNVSFSLKGKVQDAREVASRFGARYVLEGSVRKPEDRVRISAALVDGSTGAQVWAQRYDFLLADVLAVQDAIAQQVAGAMEPELLKSESASAMHRATTSDVTAWDITLRGLHCFHKIGRATHLKARELFREAARLDAESAGARVWLARVSAGLVAYGWSDDRERDLREGVEAARAAIRLEERSPYSHYALAIVSVYAEDFPQATRAARRALELNPSFALGHLVLGMSLLFSGNAVEAAESLERGLQLNPYDPQNFVWYGTLAYARIISGRPEMALQCVERASDLRPDWLATLKLEACCHVAMDRIDEARKTVQRMRRCDDAPDNIFGPLERGRPEWREKIAALLSRAGPLSADR